MIRFLCKAILRHDGITIQKSHFFAKQSSTLSVKHISSTSNQNSFTVAYLINSCGLSSKSALSASKYVRFEIPDKADRVLAFFRNHGFSETQIIKTIRQFPPILLSDIEKTHLPKLEFLYSKGFSRPEVSKVVAICPTLLRGSLKKTIIPNFDFFTNLFQSEEKAIDAVKRFPYLLITDPETSVTPKINALQEYGVPKSNFISLFVHQPGIIRMSLDQFKEILEKLMKLGFNPLRFKFVVALFAFKGMSKFTWKKKVDVYKRWGLSEEEVFEAFVRDPRCMTASEIKITIMMDILVNKMGYKPSVIVKLPALLTLSIEKRIVPRSTVFEALLSKSLLEKEFPLSASFFRCNEKNFLERFINCYEIEAPQLLRLYKEKLDLARN